MRDRTDLLQPILDIPAELKYYRVNKYLIVCDVRESELVVLTVVHASMDLPSRVAELLPSMATEVEFLHERLRKANRRPS